MDSFRPFVVCRSILDRRGHGDVKRSVEGVSILVCSVLKGVGGAAPGPPVLLMSGVPTNSGAVLLFIICVTLHEP